MGNTGQVRHQGVAHIVEVYGADFELTGSNAPLVVDFVVVSETVQFIVVSARGTERRYSLYQVMQELGTSDEILLLADPDSYQYFVALTYLSIGVGALYSADMIRIGANYQVCPSETAPELTLWSPDRLVLDISEYFPPFGLAHILRPLEEVTDLQIDDFASRFADPTACLTTPRSHWVAEP